MLKKIIIIGIVALIIVASGVVSYLQFRQAKQQLPVAEPVVPLLGADPKNALYRIEGIEVQLQGGISEVSIPDSGAKITTRYFGNEVQTDVNGDGRIDTVFLLTQDPGGTGTFYYVVAALQTEQGYTGTNAVLLGDRIAPQSSNVEDGIMVINYAIRSADEPMTTEPSIGVSKYFKLVNGELSEVAAHFEGEADPALMTLAMKSWKLLRAELADGVTFVPSKPEAFTLTLLQDGTFSATTDCNSVSGKYTTADNKLAFSEIASTLMFCDGSQESEFLQFLTNTTGYHFTSKGELILSLQSDGGSVLFR